MADISRHGTCPHCGMNWDGGDIKAHLQSLDVFMLKDEASMQVIAKESFGWLPEAPTKLSLVRGVVDKEHGIDALECPRCYSVWDKGIRYPSMVHLYKSLEVEVVEPVSAEAEENWEKMYNKLQENEEKEEPVKYTPSFEEEDEEEEQDDDEAPF